MSTDTRLPQGVAGSSLTQCPYKGLQPYSEEDTQYYFGRDAERDLVIANLMASRLTLLYGPSGVGKSSLLRAAAVPMLRRMPDTSFSYLAVGHAVVVYHSTWRDDPLASLGDALRDAIPEKLKPVGFIPPPGPLSVELLRSVSAAVDADVYIFLDQFEEQSLYVAPVASEALAVALGQIVTAPGLRASVLIGVREDALAKLDHLEAYVPSLFTNNLRLDHLTMEAARRAIEQPVVRFNADVPVEEQVSIEAGLVDTLLQQLRTGRVSVGEAGHGGRDTAAATIETPYLQLVMTRLWTEERTRGSRVMRESTLHELGDAERIVRTHLDNVMSELGEDERSIAAAIFRHLVTPSGMKIAHTAEDLAEYAGLTEVARVSEVLNLLASGRERILRPVEPPVDRPGAPRFEIFHDVLAAAVLDWRRRFVAEQDQELARRRLVEERQDAERQHAETKQRLRRARVLAAGLVVLLVLAVSAGVFAFRSSSRARAAAMLSESQALLASDPAASLQRALDAHRTWESTATETALRIALASDHERLKVEAETGFVNLVGFSPDGQRFVSAGSSGSAKLFDASTGALLRTFAKQEGSGQLNSAEFSPDGTMVAVTTSAPKALVYDARTGDLLLTVGDYKYYVEGHWSSLGDRQLLVTGGYGHAARAWDARSGALVRTYGDPQSDSMPMAVSRDSAEIVVAGKDRLHVYDGRSGRLLKSSGGVDPANTASLAFAGGSSSVIAVWMHPTDELWGLALWDWADAATPKPTGAKSHAPSPIIVSASGARIATILDKYVYVLDPTDPTAGFALPEQADLLTAVQFSQDETHLVTAGLGGQAQVWRLAALEQAPVASLLGHKGGISDVRFSPTEQDTVLTAGYDGTVRLWQLPSRTTVSTAGTWMQDANLSPDGRLAASLTDSGQLELWDVRGRSTTQVGHLSSSGAKVDFWHVRWLPDGKRLVASAGYDSAPWIWDSATGKDAELMEANDEWTSGLAVSPGGGLVAMGDEANRVVLWSTATSEISTRLVGGDPSYRMSAVEFVPGSSLVAGASTDGTVRIWDVTTSEVVRTLGTLGSAPISALEVSRDGTWLATASYQHEISVYDLRTGRLERSMAGPSSHLGAIAFNTDATLVGLAAGDGAVYIMNRSTGELVTVIKQHSTAINAVEFTRDGKQLLTASDDGTAALYDCVTCGAFDAVLADAEARSAARTKGSMVPPEPSGATPQATLRALAPL